MSRERLTTKVAETLLSKPGTSVEEKDSGIPHDVYTMNNPEHEKNNPDKDEYVIGDPSKFGEDVNKENRWKKDLKSRDPETNHPLNPDYPISKSAAEAVKQAKILEEKAVKCIIASQRILPGAPDGVVEEQATELMYLPLQAVNAMLTRQEKLAMMISDAADEAEKEAGNKGEIPEGLKKFQEKKKGEKPEAEAPEGETPEEGEKDAGGLNPGLKAYQDAQKAKKGEKPEVEAKKKDEKLPEGMDPACEEGKDAKKEPAKKDPMQEMEEKLAAMSAELEEMKKGKKAPAPEEACDASGKMARDQSKNDAFYTHKGLTEKEQTQGEKSASIEVEASSTIDDIFSAVMASDEKKGAKTLTGLVKKEASNGSEMDGVSLWGAPPDVSSHFNINA